jgi:hypothetical protein
MTSIASHALGAFVNAFCAILLVRVAMGRANSRYLWHLAMAWGLFSLDRIVAAAGYLFIQLLGSGPLSPDSSAAHTFSQIDTLISISATFFLFLGSFLVFEYPHQRIPTIPAQLSVFIFGFFALIASLANLSQTALPVVQFLDAATSTLSVAFLGVSLAKLRLVNKLDHTTDLFNFVAMFFVFSNVLLQPLWYFADKYPDYLFWYYPTLSASSMLIVVSISMFSIRLLPEKFAAAPKDPGEINRLTSDQQAREEIQRILQSCMAELEKLQAAMKRLAGSS